MTEVITYRTREDGFLIVLIELTQSSTFLTFLLDPWKAGYRDFDQHKGSMKDLKRKLGAPKLKFHEIPKKDAALLLRQNVEIAKNLVLAGCKELVIFEKDVKPNIENDIASGQFFLTEDDIGKTDRASACRVKLAELNRYVKVTVVEKGKFKTI